MTDKTSNRDIYERLVKLETQMSEVCKQVNTIKNNDIAHLQQSCDRIAEKLHEMDKNVSLNTVKLAAVVSLIMIVANFVVTHFLKNIL